MQFNVFRSLILNCPFRFPLRPLQSVMTAIDMHDMEQLAEMVLNGDGQFLVGTKSDQPEIQAFLDNVPVYMVRQS